MIIQSIAIAGICAIVIGLVIVVGYINKKYNAAMDAMVGLFSIVNEIGLQTNKLTKEVLPDDDYKYEIKYTDENGNTITVENLEEFFNGDN